MLVTLGIDSAFGYIDYLMEFYLDAFPVILTKMRKEVFCVLVVFICFISSLMFVTDAGYYVFNMFDGYACGVSLYFCLIMECIVIAWIFGIEKLYVKDLSVLGRELKHTMIVDNSPHSYAFQARSSRTGSHATASARCTPFLEDFRRRFSPPTPRFQRPPSTPFNSD